MTIFPNLLVVEPTLPACYRVSRNTADFGIFAFFRWRSRLEKQPENGNRTDVGVVTASGGGDGGGGGG